MDPCAQQVPVEIEPIRVMVEYDSGDDTGGGAYTVAVLGLSELRESYAPLARAVDTAAFEAEDIARSGYEWAAVRVGHGDEEDVNAADALTVFVAYGHDEGKD